MSDTEKLRRPDFERRGKKASGRVEHDERGNAVWVRTRWDDGPEIADTAGLSLADERSEANAEAQTPAKPTSKH